MMATYQLWQRRSGLSKAACRADRTQDWSHSLFHEILNKKKRMSGFKTGALRKPHAHEVHGFMDPDILEIKII